MNRKERRSREAQARAAPPGSTDPELREMMRHAVELHRDGRIGQAVAAYEAVLEREPRHADALQFMGVAEMQSGRGDEAIGLLRQAVGIDPGNSRAHYNLGLAMRAAGRESKALAAFRRAIAVEPRNFEAHNAIAAILLAAPDQLETAEAHISRALENNPKYVPARNNLALLLKARGRPEEAASEARVAVTQAPAHTPALITLGALLLEMGETEEAEQILRDAVALAPEDASAHSNLGAAFIHRGAREEAEAEFERALELDPDNSESLSNLALIRKNQERLDEAAALLQRALVVKPDDAALHMNLGRIFMAGGRAQPAITHYEQAIELDANYAEAYVYLGQAVHFLGRIDEAMRCGEAAVRLDPSSADGHLNLGSALQVCGRIEEAISHFRKAITLNGRLTGAYLNYAYARRVVEGDSYSDNLLAALAQPDWNDDERADLLYAAGKVESDRGSHNAAFTHWAQGARLRRKTIKYAIADSRKIFASYQAIFDSPLLERRLHQPVAGPTPIFIVGMPRSGTTLVEQILASHPQVTGLGELHHIADITHGFSDWSEAAGIFPAALAGLDESHWARAAKLYMERLDRNEGEPYISDKMPGNFQYLGFISLLFPNARIVHCRRSALDTCVSCFTTFFNVQEWSFDLSDIGAYYGLYLDLMAHWRRVLPLPIYDIQYESVVADLPGEARRLLDFCGLDWHPDCLEFHRNKRPVFTHSNTQVRQPIYASSVGRWRRYEDQLQPLIDMLPPDSIL
jgi:tetratricopeptide (TPR) repeat protein